MRKLLTVLGVVVLVVYVSAMVMPVSFSQEKQATSEKAVSKNTSGEIVSVDPSTGTIKIKYFSDDARTKSEELTLSTASETVIAKNGTKITISDLTAGSKVYVEYSVGKEGKNTVNKILVEGNEAGM